MAEIDRAEALALPARARVGRVVFSQDALPAVRPVNFVVLGSDVAFRIRGDSVLAAAVGGDVVAFEADELDVDARVGWSVVVTGLAELTGPGPEYDRVVGLLPEAWSPDCHDQVVRIRVQGCPVDRYPVRRRTRGDPLSLGLRTPQSG